MIERPRQGKLLTIGAVARATGVPTETLRTWERRYGFPNAERTITGHRRYTLETVERVRLVLSALKLGHRPALALTASEADLQALLARAEPPVANASDDDDEAIDRDAVSRWLELIRRFDGRALDRELRLSLAATGVTRCLTLRIAPLIHEIGERWSIGQVGVRHEHFATERLNEFLARHWRPLSDSATGPFAVAATPSGERHTLGLQMVALTLAINNIRVVYLGADVPAAEIAQSVAQHGARAVVLSAARSMAREQLLLECRSLRTSLGAELPIVVGGDGFEHPPEGVTLLPDLRLLDSWAREFSRGSSPN
jgi:methanogenic corrinoid protein MtbC1